ncbi:TetR/AcrR family transcriptional regulator [Pseudonocardia sp. H11422]|uniref:TetR/AcrR family transcriptional regulator n=1 Tax=Pseudonocardia sp. H11422 TaxID=2835866 RepID=UPI001BDD6292|nr:TetR/AcrR family transcriptional regulator [Pseudonocardia sp. H11422]
MDRRTYGGRDAAARTAERRASLMDAGLRMWSDGGWAAVTVRGVCAAAGLTERYFYQSFTDREALLLAIFDASLDDTLAAVLAAMETAPGTPAGQLRAAIGAFVGRISDDPRHAVGLVEPIGSPALRRHRRAASTGFAELVAARAGALTPDADQDRLRAAARFCVGGLTELIICWLDGDRPSGPDEIVEHGVRLFQAALRTG